MKSRTEYLRDYLTNVKMELRTGMNSFQKDDLGRDMIWTLLGDENFKILIDLLNQKVREEEIADGKI